MIQKKGITTAPVTEANIITMMNREFVPKLRELSKLQGAVVIIGSRSTGTALVLTQLLTLLAQAGVITDQTIP